MILTIDPSCMYAVIDNSVNHVNHGTIDSDNGLSFDQRQVIM